MKLNEPIFIFGDSIMKGIVVGEEKRYKIGNTLGVDTVARRFGLNIDNCSRFGCTIEKGVGIMKRTLEKNDECSAAVLEYGGNDCDFNWPEVAGAPEQEHFPHTPLEKFTHIYTDAVEYLRGKKITPILTTLPPLCAERYLNWTCRNGLNREAILRWLGDVNAIYRYQELYSMTVAQLAEKLGTKLVDLRETFLEERRMEEYFCEDGIHPNENGHRLIRETFSRFIESSGIEPVTA